MRRTALTIRRHLEHAADAQKSIPAQHEAKQPITAWVLPTERQVKAGSPPPTPFPHRTPGLRLGTAREAPARHLASLRLEAMVPEELGVLALHLAVAVARDSPVPRGRRPSKGPARAPSVCSSPHFGERLSKARLAGPSWNWTRQAVQLSSHASPRKEEQRPYSLCPGSASEGRCTPKRHENEALGVYVTYTSATTRFNA